MRGLLRILFIIIPFFLVLFLYRQTIHSSDYQTLKPEKVTASSFLKPALGFTFNPENLTDNDPATCWQTKKGKGSWVEFSFKSPVILHQIDMVNGFQLIHSKFGNLYRLNSRIKTAGLYFNGAKTPKMIQIEDKDETTRFVIDQTNVKTVRLEIQDIYPGEKWNDLAISEITFTGKLLLTGKK